MAELKPTLKRVVPGSAWRKFSGAYWWWYNRGRHQAAAALSSRWKNSKAQLGGFADLHRGQRCFVIGNGPSLKNMDLSPLRGEITFGTNRIYLMFDELGYSTSYYVAVNTLVIEQCAEEIRRLAMPKFLTWRGRRWLVNDPQVIFLDTDYSQAAAFATDITGRVFEGGTVTYVALQLAYFMGFEEVILIGVDHRYRASGLPNRTVESQGEDPNHFHPAYFGKGFRWQLPDLEASERSYRLAKEAFEGAGRRVLDATIDGDLSIFPKADYRSLFPPKA